MGERVQPGAEIPKETYEKFKTFVENQHGTVRGNLGSELTRAMQDHMRMQEGNAPTERIEQDIATVNRNVAETRELMKELATALDEVDADGGAYTLSHDETTHTHRSEPDGPDTGGSDSEDEKIDAPEEPPHPKAARSKKATWLEAQYRDADEIHVKNDLAGEVKETYSFGRDAAKKLVDAAIERLPHVPHPRADELLVSPETAEQIEARLAEETRAEATEDLDALDAADPADAPDR